MDVYQADYLNGLSWWNRFTSWNDNFWNDRYSDFKGFWRTDEGKSIFGTGMANWQLNMAYGNAQKYLGLLILGYISYKTFK